MSWKLKVSDSHVEIVCAVVPLLLFFGGIALVILELRFPSQTLVAHVAVIVAALFAGVMGLWGFVTSFIRK